MRRISAGWIAVALVALPLGFACAQAIERGFELERAGRHADAVDAYLAALHGRPANTAALLGLERSLAVLGRLRELPPLVQRGLAVAPGDDALRGLAVRTYVALGRGDSAEAFARRWAAAAEGDEHPYRELALAYQDEGNFVDARRVLLAGRKALARPDALAVELADLADRVRDWTTSANEWARAVTASSTYQSTAVDRLRDAPDTVHERVVATLVATGATGPRRVAAELLLAWGDPAGAWRLFEQTLSEGSPAQAHALRRFADQAGAAGTPAGRRVRGLALARFADLVPAPLSTRVRTEAAEALLDAGDHAAARAVFETVSADPRTPTDVRSRARAALVRSLIAGGALDSAAAALAAAGPAVLPGEQLKLRLEIARARIVRGDLAGVGEVLAGDSSVDATALRGWAALYAGELSRAAELFQAAGPYAGPRDDATERSRMLALLQRIAPPRSPALGHALRVLAAGDSVAAVTALRAAAEPLGPDAGRPEVVLLAGQVAAGLGGTHDSAAVRLFAEVVATGRGGTPRAAPAAAELEWALLLIRGGRAEEAISHLEHLILTYPESAVVPQARRELERARGAIPRS